MASRILDHAIMLKLAKKLGKKDTTAINKLVYSKARRQGITSEEALIELAKENGIGYLKFKKRLNSGFGLDPKTLPPSLLNGNTHHKSGLVQKNSISEKSLLKASVRSLIQDAELFERCGDLLVGLKHFDRPINQATLLLEDRIRHKANPPKKLVGENLVGYAFNEDISRSILKVSSGDTDDQRGFTQILKGIVPTFRNKTHHHVTSNFSREDAMRVCGFIDVLLRIVDESTN